MSTQALTPERPLPLWHRVVARIQLLPPPSQKVQVKLTLPVLSMLVGYGFVALILAIVSVRGTADPWPLVGSVLLLGLIAGYSVDAIGGTGTMINTNDFMYLGIAFTYGPLGCLCAAAVDVIARKVMGPFDSFRTAFNFVNFFVSSLAAWFVFSRLSIPGEISWRTALVGALAGFTLFVVQHVFILYLMYFVRHEPIWPTAKGFLIELSPFYTGYGFAAVSFVVMYRSFGFLGVLSIVTPVLLLQGFLVYLARRIYAHQIEIEAEHKAKVELLQDLVLKQRKFVADAAHELRTPLTTMSGGLEILQVMPDLALAQRQELIDNALTESRRLSNLADALLELTALDAGEQTKHASFDWDELVSQQVDDMKKRIAPREFEVHINGKLGKGFGDLKRLTRMFTIMGDNVAAHTPETSKAVLTAERKKDGTIHIVVEDDGPGVPQEFIERVFERFVQVDPSRHQGRPGMGLAVATSIATTHRGSIHAELVEPHGLRVVAEFPFDVAITP